MITVDKISNIVQNLDIQLVVTNSIQDVTSFVVDVYTENTLYLYEGKCITINGRRAKVVSLTWNEMVQLLFDDEGTLDIGTYSIESPFYTWGTIKAFVNEMKKIDYTGDKYPIIYLFERYTETEFHGSNEAFGVESDLRLFFLSNYDVNDYTNKDHYNQIIKAMTNLKNLFIQALKDNTKIGELTNSRNSNYVKFGTYTDNKGNLKNLVRDNLTGIEMRITIPFYKDCC